MRPHPVVFASMPLRHGKAIEYASVQRVFTSCRLWFAALRRVPRSLRRLARGAAIHAPVSQCAGFLLGAALAGLAASAQGADWKLEKGISARATYTDNVNLAPSGREESDLYTEVRPHLGIRGKGGRLQLSADYSPRLLYYVNENSRSRVAHELASSAKLEAIENFFFIDANADISQEFVSPFGPQPGDVGLDSGNRIETRRLRVSPYIQGRTVGNIDYLGRYETTWTDTDRESLANARRTRWLGRLSGPPQRIGWSAEAFREETKFEDQQTFTNNLGRLIVSYRVVPTFRLEARGGYEQNNFGLTDREGALYGAGLDWRPTPRTVVNGFWEERFFGSSFGANITHRTRLTAWRLAASRDISDFPQELFTLQPGFTPLLLDAIFAARIPDPVERFDAVIRFLQENQIPLFLNTPLRFFTQRIFLRERYEASAAINGVRNTVVFSVFYSDNEPVSTTNATLPAELLLVDQPFTQTGASISYTLRLTRLSNVNLLLAHTRTKREQTLAGSRPDSKQDSVRLTYSTQLAPKTRGLAGLRYQQFDSDDPLFNNYNEFAVFVGLDHRF